MYSMFLILSGAILVVIEYYYQYPWWVQHGGSNTLLEQLVYGTWKSGTLEQEGFVRFCCLFFCAIGVVIRQGDSKDSKWVEVLVPLLSGLAVFMTVQYWSRGFAYVFLTLCSYVAFLVGAILLGRKFRSFSANLPDYNDTFPQCEELIENELSVNIPIKYQLDGQMRDAYINVVSPQRGCMVLGTPGSGKTYSIYGPFIRQMIQKQYSMFVYDYKYPDLTKRVLNELLDNYDCYDIKPKMYIVNFDDPLHSHRFNPIHPRYLTDPVDSTEISELIMKNVNRVTARTETISLPSPHSATLIFSSGS